MNSPRPLLCAVLVLAAGSLLHADDKTAAASEAATGEPRWGIRVEALFVTMPQEKALALLPDLRDEGKIDAARAQMIEAVKRKEATLAGDLFVHTVEGMVARTETALEKIYPTEFGAYPAGKKSHHAQPSGGTDADYDVVAPVAFEKRNTGPQLAVQGSHVLNDRQWVRLTVEVSHTALLNYDAFNAGRAKDGTMLKLEQPVFQDIKDSGEIVLRSEQPVLFGVHQLTQPEGQTEIVILQANIVPLH